MSVQPGARRRRIAQWWGLGGWCGYRRQGQALGREQHAHRPGGAVQVVVEQAGERGPLALAVMGGGEGAGVGAQQVVHAVAAASCRLDQVRAGQAGQHLAGLRHCGTG